MKEFEEHENTTRLWLLALINSVDIDMLGKILGKYLELRNNNPDDTLDRLKRQALDYGDSEQ